MLFSVDPPARSNYNEDDSNNSSLIVTVYNGDDVLLFMGDAQTERLEEYLEADPVDCDFLKIPHHGGEDVLMDDLIAAVTPEYAVITSSDDEREADSTADSLNDAGTETFLTRMGAVYVLSSGTNVTVNYEEPVNLFMHPPKNTYDSRIRKQIRRSAPRHRPSRQT